MSTLLSDDDLAAAVRGVTLIDPLPDVDPATLTTRGRRGLRRRRALSVTAAGAVAAGVMVAAATLPNVLGGDDPAPLGPSPTTAPVTRAPGAVSATAADLLKRCGAQVHTDLTGWRVLASSTEPGYLTVMQALDPAGATFAYCHLVGPKLPFGIPASWNTTAPVHPQLPPNWPRRPVPHGERHMFEQGTETCGQAKPSCVGFLFYETGRLPLEAARIHAVSETGRTADFPVRNGWYAVAWADHGPGDGMRPVTWTVYDAHGKVLDTNK